MKCSKPKITNSIHKWHCRKVWLIDKYDYNVTQALQILFKNIIGLISLLNMKMPTLSSQNYANVKTYRVHTQQYGSRCSILWCCKTGQVLFYFLVSRCNSCNFSSGIKSRSWLQKMYTYISYYKMNLKSEATAKLHDTRTILSRHEKYNLGTKIIYSSNKSYNLRTI